MTRTRTIALMAATALAVAGGIAVTAQSAPTEQPTPPAATAAPTASSALAKDLTYLREEERLARDLYLAFADKYGDDTAFARVAKAEQRHYDAVGRMLERYGLTDPSEGLAAGEYAGDGLVATYQRLLAQGQKSLNDAYEAGIAFEEADVQDLTEAIERTSEADAKRVFEHLQRGSEQHLAAFTAYRDGKTPTPGEMGGRPSERPLGEAGPRGDRGPGMGREGRGMRGDGMQGGMRGEGPRAGAERPEDCPRN